ncbi:S-layer homology domain-containing protein [Paenibacillus durus]|uniref:S-layer homology domain-containing protein n=1 Tax=Paenibacillus durus TaxID=44251 RepID=UPI0012E00273|nr:S-layer homology domain-containing protein [Paenibacillus durus]
MRKKNSTLKKSLMVMLIVCMSLASFGQAFAANVNSGKASDTAGHWAESTLKEWQQQGLIAGYQDGSLKPDHKITRAEFTALINKSFGYTNTAAISYKDVKEADWYYNDVAKAAAAGYITGYTDKTFKPNKPLTREELAVIVSSLLQLNESSSPVSFTDTQASRAWSIGKISAVVEAGLMQGYSGKFRPLQTATRAEAVVVLDRALKMRAANKTVVYDKAGTYGPETGVTTITGSVYLKAPDIVLRNTVINGNLIIGEEVGKGDITLKNVTVKGTTTINGGGKNSIHVDDSVLVTVIVNKQDGSIRIVTEGSGSVQQITLQSGALLEEGPGSGDGFGQVNLSALIPANAQVGLAGTFETVDVFAASIQVNLTAGSIQNLQVGASASNTGIDIAAGASVNTLILNAPVRVTGQGSIGTAIINVSGSTISQTPANVVRAPNVTVVIGIPIDPGSGSSSPVTQTVYGFEGRITDVDDQPVADMTIHFRRGLGVTSGDIAATVVTDTYGYYFANLAPGIYTGELVKPGFITTYVVGVSLSDYKNTGQDATAIRIPAADEIRIVLTWNEQPEDEDSHLVGPAPNNKVFHTWYADKKYGYNGELYADLDHDDVDSYGPETTTIRKRVDGTYTFYVHNFSGNGPGGADTLSASGAKVEIYNGSNATPVKTYHIPAGSGKEIYWNVFNMTVNGGSLTFEDKNELTDTAPRANEDIDDATPAPDSVNVENNPGATDIVTVGGLSAGEVVNVYDHDYNLIAQSAPVQAGSDSIKLSNLNLGTGSSTIYVSITRPVLGESPRLPVTVLGEAEYAELKTTVAAAFADHEVPVTLAVYQDVYLADPEVLLPSDLQVKVIGLEPVSTVSDDVYLNNDSSKVYLNGYNGTLEPVQYKVTLELRRGFSSVTKELVLTVPTVYSALNGSIAVARERNEELNDTELQAAIEHAELVRDNQQSTLEEYLNALDDLNKALQLAEL